MELVSKRYTPVHVRVCNIIWMFLCWLKLIGRSAHVEHIKTRDFTVTAVDCLKC